MNKETKELIDKLNSLNDWINHNFDKQYDSQKPEPDPNYYTNTK